VWPQAKEMNKWAVRFSYILLSPPVIGTFWECKFGDVFSSLRIAGFKMCLGLAFNLSRIVYAITFHILYERSISVIRI